MTRALTTRRRFLSISAAACALGGNAAAATPPVARWQGNALGAGASLQLVGLAARDAGPVLADIQAEILRLERIFSLYRADSQITRLNATRHLDAPAPDLLAVLATCDALHKATDGAFDPTVQPLFAACARAAAESRLPTGEEIATARHGVGWDGVRFDAAAIRLDRPGAALTLNGIAQGYITDRIAGRLRAHGLTDVLVDMGEVAARGSRADGAPWQAGIADPAGKVLRQLRLSDRALATSAPRGTVLDPAGKLGHIFDPATGAMARAAMLVSVSAPQAVLADGLSTALCVLPDARHAAVIGHFPGARIELAA